MQTIHTDDLRSVIGGAGFMDMLGPLLQNAGPIMGGISQIISAAKGGAQPQAAADPSQAVAAQQAPAGPPPGAEPAAAAASPGFVPHHHRPRVSVSVSSF